MKRKCIKPEDVKVVVEYTEGYEKRFAEAVLKVLLRDKKRYQK